MHTPAPASVPSTISVAGRAGHAFTPQAMLKGFESHRGGVELQDPKKDRVRAHVRAKNPYDVELRIANNRLVIQCTCPAESMTSDPCRHAWAALLEVDRQGALDELRAKRGPLKVEMARAAAPAVKPPSSPTKTKKPPPAPAPASAPARKKVKK